MDVRLEASVGNNRVAISMCFVCLIGGYFLGALWLTFCIAIAPYLVNIYEKKLKKQLKG